MSEHPPTPTTPSTAETLLQNLQRVLLDAAQEVPTDQAGRITPAAREAMRAVERTHGVQATRYGRLLSDLVAGSYAWDLFQEPKTRGDRLPRIYELCQCEPLLRVMRESGELAERERLLRQRDAALAAVWREAGGTDEDRRLGAEAVYDDYFDSVQRASETYRPHYEALRRASAGSPAPLTGPRVRGRPFLQPPLMALLFSACHLDKDDAFGPALGDPRGGREYRHGRNSLQVLPADPAPIAGRDTALNREQFQAWAGDGVGADLAKLDAMAWDIAALAVSAFYVRTDGADIDSSFPFLIDDYFHWRGVDPRKRTRELRQEVEARLELLCSDRMQVHSETELWLTDPGTGQRRKTPVVAEGSFLVKRSRFSRRDTGGGATPDGYLLSLGEWARKFVEERAMLGVSLRRLAEYDLQRQQWERRIGWYLVFQMNNQASKMTFRDVVQDGKARTQIIPQHPLKMQTVLSNSHVPWEETARTNPGKVIKQWCDALDTLRRDGVIGPYACLDGPPDGADLPVRGRLGAMLERRYQFVPGKDLLPHLRAKQGAAQRKRLR